MVGSARTTPAVVDAGGSTVGALVGRRRLGRRLASSSRARRVAGGCAAGSTSAAVVAAGVASTRSAPTVGRRCSVDVSARASTPSLPSGTDVRRRLLDGRRARLHHRAQLHDAGDVDGVERLALVRTPGRSTTMFSPSTRTSGSAMPRSFQLVADQVADDVEVLGGRVLLGRQHDGDPALEVEAEHRLVVGDEVGGQQHDGDDDDPDRARSTDDGGSFGGWLVRRAVTARRRRWAPAPGP